MICAKCYDIVTNNNSVHRDMTWMMFRCNAESFCCNHNYYGDYC